VAEDQNQSDRGAVALTRTGFAFLLIAAMGFVAAIIWVSFPGIDLWVADLFERGDYSDARRFYLREHPIPKFLNDLVKEGANVVAFIILFGLIFTSIAKRPFLKLSKRKYWFLFASFISGPLLVANALFKENWGRARPRDVTEFGGDFMFTPPLMITDQCETNCSFVSGDASLAFTMIAFAFVTPIIRTRWLVLATGFGVIIGINRIVQGAHFLSDTLFAAIFMSLCVLLMYMIVIEQRWGVSKWCEVWIGGGANSAWRSVKRLLGNVLDKIRPGTRQQMQAHLVNLGFRAREPQMETPVFRPNATLGERIRFFFRAKLDEVAAIKTTGHQETEGDAVSLDASDVRATSEDTRK